MPSTPDWKKEAEEEDEKEQKKVNAQAKSRFYLLSFLLVFVGVIMATFHVVWWLVVGGNFLPPKGEAVWVVAGMVGAYPLTYFIERYDRIREIREQRLIRLEMKLDALLDRQKP